MNVESLNPAILKKVIALLERREELQRLIAEMNEKIAELISAEEVREESTGKRKGRGRGLRTNPVVRHGQSAARKNRTATAEAVSKKARRSLRSPRMGHGDLKNGILEALRASGPEGCSIDELAEKLQVERRKVKAWFASTGKRLGGFRKNDQGHWVID